MESISCLVGGVLHSKPGATRLLVNQEERENIGTEHNS
jgi:hypothetical protein